MSETNVKNARELQTAIADYKKFLRFFEASPKTTSLGRFDRDKNVKICQVDWTVALKCFLGENPSYKRFRNNLSKVRRDESPFRFNEELWNERRGDGGG